MPPRVLASRPKPCGGNNWIGEHKISKVKKYIFASNPEKRTQKQAQKDMNEMAAITSFTGASFLNMRADQSSSWLIRASFPQSTIL